MPPVTPVTAPGARETRPTPRQVRTLRGVSAAAIATLIAATAHTLAGGGAPSPAIVAVVVVLASPLAVLLAGRSLSLWRLALTVLASQGALHVAFAIASGATGLDEAPHAHHAAVEAPAATSAVAASLDPWMLLGHALAAVVTIAALHRGERMLRALARGILRLLRRRLAVPPHVYPPVPAPDVAAGRGIRPPLFSSEVSRRGPPAVLAAR